MQKVNFVLLCLLFTLPFVISITDWNYRYGTPSTDYNIGTANSALLTDYSTSVGATNKRETQTGDINGDNLPEVLSISASGINVYNRTLGFLGKFPANQTTEQIYQFTLSDVDADGRQEIISTSHNTSNKGTIRVYGYSSGSYVKVHEYPLPNRVAIYVPPVCELNICYVADDSGNIYKYNANTNTMLDSASIGGVTLHGMTKDDCVDWSGDELILLGDWDADSGYSDMAVVSTTNMSHIVRITSHDKVYVSFGIHTEILNPAVCDIVDGQKYIYTTAHDDFYTTTRTYWIFKDRILSNDSIITQEFWIANGTGGDGVDAYSFSQPILVDIIAGGNKEICYWYFVSGGSGSFDVFKCLNSTGGTVLATSGSYFTEDEANPYMAQAYVGDINNNGNIDVMVGQRYIDTITGTHSYLSTWAGLKDRNILSFTRYGTSCLDYYSSSGDGNIHARVSNSPTCSYSTPEGSVYLFEENFGTGFNFDVNQSMCLVNADGYTHTQFLSHTPKYTGGNYDWICWSNSSSGSPIVHYEDSSDTSHIATDLGIKHSVSGANTIVSSWASSGNYNIDMSGGTDYHFQFTCDMQNQTNGYSYLLMGAETPSGIAPYYSAYLSLSNGGCAYNSSLPYQTDANNTVPCCELLSIAGTDCSSGKTLIDFNEQDIDDNCFAQGVGDLSVAEIDRLEFVTLKRTSGGDTIYFDDLILYVTGVVGNNTLPFIYTMNGFPDPANVSQIVSYTVGISDSDNTASEIYSAFDCENDNILDYNWAIRGVFPVFNCSYGSPNLYTAKAWASDTSHYPATNTSLTTTTTVILLNGTTTPMQGGSCSGYSSQSCSGTCVFTDNFNYNYMIECAGWSGDVSDFHPTGNVFGIYGTNVYQSGFELDKTTANSIKSSQTTSYETKFDLMLKSNDIVNFQVYNDELNKNVLVLIINNYNLVAYKDTGSLSLGELTPNTWYAIKAIVNYNTNEVYYYIDNVLVGTINIYESGVTSSRKWVFGWADTDTMFDIDNFQINIVQQNPNATNVTTQEPLNYVYNPAMFCAINWTGNDTRRFNQQNCVDRGFSIEYPLMSLCLPRACLQDISLSLLGWATENIFTTIIIVTAFILIAPLLVALLKRR